MKLTVNKNLNVRVGSASTDAPCFTFAKPGDIIEVTETLEGTLIDGNDRWYKATDGNYYWSGGTILSLPWWIKDFGIDEIWNYTKGENIGVLLLDSGVSNYDKSNFNVRKETVLNDLEDGIGHGSLMCSIISGNNSDVIGIAPLCSIVSIKVANSIDYEWQNFLEGLKKIEAIVDVNKSYVVNFSLCGELHDENLQNEIQKKIDDYSSNYKMIFVGAVGNDYDYANDLNIIPARLNKVISVAAENRSGARLQSSNYWENIDCLCPGEFVSDSLRQKYPSCQFSGSSHACAFTSALIALFLARANQNSTYLSYDKIKSLIMTSTSSLTTKIEASPVKTLTDKVLVKDKLMSTFLNI